MSVGMRATERPAPRPDAPYSFVTVEVVRRVRVDGAALRRARERTGLSLRAVARQAGISAPHLSHIERDQRAPSAGLLARLGAIVEPQGRMPGP